MGVEILCGKQFAVKFTVKDAPSVVHDLSGTGVCKEASTESTDFSHYWQLILFHKLSCSFWITDEWLPMNELFGLLGTSILNRPILYDY